MRTATARLLRSLDGLGCRPIVVASHPRSGTHLCIDSLRLNFLQCHSWKLPFERADMLYLDLDARARKNEVRQRSILKVMERVACPVVKTHALANFRQVPPVLTGQQAPLDDALADWLQENGSLVYMYRDGREVMWSCYRLLALARSGPPVAFSDFLRQRVDGMSRPRAWAKHVEGWFEEPRALRVSMDSLLSSPGRTLALMGSKLGLSLPQDEPGLPKTCDWRFLNRLLRRLTPVPTSTAIVADDRACAPRHWTQVFSQADREFFHQEAGDMLIRLGYECCDRWVGSARHIPARAYIP